MVGTLNGNDYPSKPTHSWNSQTQMASAESVAQTVLQIDLNWRR